jgi:hypothetical protein
MRQLMIEGVRYFWQARGSDHGIHVVVATEEAFVHGQRPSHWWWRFALHLAEPER